MIYIVILMFIFLLLFNGTEFKITGIFILVTALFALLSSLFMILYGDGEHMLVKFGIIQISEESIVKRFTFISKNDYCFNVWYSHCINLSNRHDFLQFNATFESKTKNRICLYGSN